MNEIKQALGGLSISQPTIFKNLSVFPLISEAEHKADYLSLSEALRLGVAKITEISESGHVPRLSFLNKADVPVLLLDGEELIGCKQNRVLNLTILAPAQSEIQIPVSCVERGRWRAESAQFSVSNRSMFAESRAAKVADVSHFLCTDGIADSDQSAIWARIDEKSARLGSASESAAMSGIYRRREADVDAYLRQLATLPKQVGAVFAINGRIVGLELFDAAATCERYINNVASGFALDAIDHYTSIFPEAAVEGVSRFLDRVSAADEKRFASVGMGEDLRLHGSQFAAAGLAVSGRLVHLCAFDLGSAERNDGALERERPLRRPRRPYDFASVDE